MTSPIRPRFDQKTNNQSFFRFFHRIGLSMEKKNFERKSGKKIIIKPITKPNANRKAQYKINLISNYGSIWDSLILLKLKTFC